MAVVNRKNFLGLELSDWHKQMLAEKFISQGPTEHRELREHYITLYTSDTENNYVISKPAQETIENIKLDDPVKTFPMIIEKADDQGTLLLNKEEFFRYYRINQTGEDHLIGIWVKKELDPNGKTAMIDGEMVKDFYFYYESFRIMPDEFSHPDMYKGMHPKIKEFIKTLIFVKCSNIETYLMRPMEKARPPKMQDSKWINKAGIPVTLVNADWNRMYIKAEGFKVRGHVRFQRHGKENKEIKIIYIDSYTKKGYKRQFHN